MNVPLDRLRKMAVAEIDCWPVYFRTWLVQEGDQFPTLNFHAQLKKFVTAYPQYGQHVFFDQEKKRVVAVTIRLRLTSPGSTTRDEALVLEKAFDEHLTQLEESVPRSRAEAWHTSYLWVRAEAERMVVESTLASIAVGILCGAVAMFVFTLSFAASVGLIL